MGIESLVISPPHSQQISILAVTVKKYWELTILPDEVGWIEFLNPGSLDSIFKSHFLASFPQNFYPD